MGLVLTWTGWSQGQINFNNSPASLGGGGAPVFEVDGQTRLAGSLFLAQLYAGATPESLLPVGYALPFRTGAGAGFVDITGYDPVVTVPSVAPGDLAYVQMRAWFSLGGATYEAAEAAKSAAGQSAVFTVKTGGEGSPPSLPANLTGLSSFSISRGSTLGGVATVNFNNSRSTVGGNGAPIVDGVTGVGLGSAFVAQLWAGPSPEWLSPIGEPLYLRDGAGAGFINTTGIDTVRQINSVMGGDTAFFQVRAWEWSFGTTYEQAMGSGGKTGRSNIFSGPTGGNGQPASLPTNLVGLQSFSVWPSGPVAIPEPNSMILLALGSLLIGIRHTIRR